MRVSQAKGLCPSHYRRWLDSGTWPETPISTKVFKKHTGECLRPDCTAMSRGSGYCMKHYSRARIYVTKYNMNGWDDFDLLWSRCDGVCGVCKKSLDPDSRDTHVDHDHATGLVRGLLCQRCNQALGFLDDDIDRAHGVVLYLQNPPGSIGL